MRINKSNAAAKKTKKICRIIDALAKVLKDILCKRFPEKCSRFYEVRRLKSRWPADLSRAKKHKKMEV